MNDGGASRDLDTYPSAKRGDFRLSRKGAKTRQVGTEGLWIALGIQFGKSLYPIAFPPMNEIYSLHRDRDIQPTEFGQLATLNLWGEVADFTQERLAGHFAAVDFAAHVRTSQDLLVGYASAISNGLGAVFIDSLISHPEYDREAIGDLLLRAVLTHFSGQPVYAMPFVDEQQVFRASGFRVYRREMVALAHRNDEPSGLGGITATEAVIHS